MKCNSLLSAFALMFVPLYTAVSQTMSAQTSSTVSAASAYTAVPPLVPYSGVALDASGRSVASPTSITFLVFKDETGGEPLFAETQSVAVDAAGHYKVQLGATLANGLPSDLFATGEARWLEVQIAGQAPQPRVLIASVPYALKAADASTLGGLPASAFALAGQTLKSTAAPAGVTPDTVSNVTTTGGTAGYVPEFSSATTVVDSPIFVLGSNVGIGTATPTTTLNVVGTGATIDAPLALTATGTATVSAGFDSNLLKFYTSAYNSSTKAVVDPRFEWEAVPSGNNTASPAAKLELLSSTGTPSVAPTGFSFNLNGTINFAPGQTFPGADITGTVNATGYDLGGSLFAPARRQNLPHTWALPATRTPLAFTAPILASATTRYTPTPRGTSTPRAAPMRWVPTPLGTTTRLPAAAHCT